MQTDNEFSPVASSIYQEYGRAHITGCDDFVRGRNNCFQDENASRPRIRGALSFGGHSPFVQTSTGQDLVVFWAQAIDRHFRPIEW
jgi:hypothetical protein